MRRLLMIVLTGTTLSASGTKIGTRFDFFSDELVAFVFSLDGDHVFRRQRPHQEGSRERKFDHHGRNSAIVDQIVVPMGRHVRDAPHALARLSGTSRENYKRLWFQVIVLGLLRAFLDDARQSSGRPLLFLAYFRLRTIDASQRDHEAVDGKSPPH